MTCLVRAPSRAAYPVGAAGWLSRAAHPVGGPSRAAYPPGAAAWLSRAAHPGRLPIWHRRVALPGGLPGRGRGVALPGDTPGRVTLLGGIPIRRCRVALPGDLPSQGSLPGSPPGLSTHLAARQGALPSGLPISVGGPAQVPWAAPLMTWLLYAETLIFKNSHTNLFFGKLFCALHPLRASFRTKQGRWVYERG